MTKEHIFKTSMTPKSPKGDFSPAQAPFRELKGKRKGKEVFNLSNEF